LHIPICDLVPLHERGKFIAMVMSAGADATTVGPVISGALAEELAMGILSNLNLPFGGVTVLCLFFFLHIEHKREPTWAANLARIDVLGGVLIALILLALVMGGSLYP
jgi:MFS family permease